MVTLCAFGQPENDPDLEGFAKETVGAAAFVPKKENLRNPFDDDST